MIITADPTWIMKHNLPETGDKDNDGNNNAHNLTNKIMKHNTGNIPILLSAYIY